MVIPYPVIAYTRAQGSNVCGAWIIVKSRGRTLGSITEAIRKGLFYASSGPETLAWRSCPRVSTLRLARSSILPSCRRRASAPALHLGICPLRSIRTGVAPGRGMSGWRLRTMRGGRLDQSNILDLITVCISPRALRLSNSVHKCYLIVITNNSVAGIAISSSMLPCLSLMLRILLIMIVFFEGSTDYF